MSIDFEKYLKENCDSREVRSDPDERVITCITCDKPYHLYFNIKTNLWTCKRCGAEGNGVTFIMYHRGVGYFEALDFINSGEEKNKSKTLQNIIKNMKKDLSFKINSSNKVKLNVGKCDKWIMNKEKYNQSKHLKRRHISYHTFKKIDPTPFVCANHRKFDQLNDRMIFPILCDGHVSYQAYDITGQKIPKTWNPPGSINSELIFMYDQFKNSTKPLVVTEGIFDSLRILDIDSSVNAVPLLGSNLSIYQAYLLGNTQASEIILMLDGDVWIKKENKYFDKIYSKMNSFCDKWTVVKIRDPKKDPGNLTEEEYFKIMKRRYKPNEMEKTTSILARLRG